MEEGVAHYTLEGNVAPGGPSLEGNVAPGGPSLEGNVAPGGPSLEGNIAPALLKMGCFRTAVWGVCMSTPLLLLIGCSLSHHLRV